MISLPQSPNSIRLFDLTRQYAEIEQEIQAAIAAVFKVGVYTKGPFVDAFEEQWAAYCGTQYAVGVSSGTTALELLFRAYDIGAGDEVIVPANTAIPTAMAVSNVGARPILVDCERESANIDPSLIPAAVTLRTKAIVPVHLYGRPVRIGEILDIANRYGLAVIEDAAQAHGARLLGKRVGSFGHSAAFSFHPSKNLGAYGDAGMVTTNDSMVRDKVAQLRDIGQSARYRHVRIGTVGRLDDLQAAMLSVKLLRLDRWIAARRDVAARYTNAFADTPIVVSRPSADEFAVFHLFVVEVSDRATACAALDAAGIDWGIHYPTPIHRQQAYVGIPIAPFPLPVAESRCNHILSLPMSANIEAHEVDRIIDVLLQAVKQAV